MRRALAVYLLLFLGLGLFAGFAWLTRNPDAEILRRAESWPWVGPLALYFREAYRPAAKTETAGTETEIIWVGKHGLEKIEPGPAPPVYRRHVWVLPGLELKAGPSSDAATIETFEKLTKAGRIERRGDWYHVDRNGLTGWVLLEGYDENAEIPYGESPEPPRPLPARAPDEENLATARQFLRNRERTLSLGPYTLYTDSSDDGLISFLDTVTAPLEALYAERYGRQPIGTAAEAVVLFKSDIAYRLMQQRTDRLSGLASAGHNFRGLAVFYVGGRSRNAVAGTLIHELVHFLNRRALGPQLPPWLDEGLADDLALSRIDASGRIHLGELRGDHRQYGEQWWIAGGHASLLKLRDAARTGELSAARDLIQLDWDSFVRTPQVQLHYATAAFWVRFLIDGAEGRRAAAFRAFLDDVAEGQPPSAENLQARLGEDWSTLDRDFRQWLEAGARGLDRL